MTQETYDLIHRLSRCTFAPASFDKRFVRDLSALTLEATLSEKQLLCLGQIAYRYRKQLSLLK